MAAVATRSATEPRVTYPVVTNEMLDDMRAQQRELLRAPERTKPAVELFRKERYIFRSNQGLSRIVHHLDVKPEVSGEGQEAVHRRLQLSSWNRRYKDDPQYGDKMADLVERLGGTFISFQRVAKEKECFFATDDPVIAAYIRDLIARQVGEFAECYEESGTSRLVVGDKAFPNSPMGRQAAYEYAAQTGVEDIKIVQE